jgi:hypothetical protein
MTTRTLGLSMVLWTVMAGGCGTHHALCTPRVSMKEAGLLDGCGQAATVEFVADQGIAMMLDTPVRPHLPAAVAVARLRASYKGLFELVDLEAGELAAWKTLCQDVRAITKFQPVTTLLTGGATVSMSSLRQAAARLGCELLLIYMTAETGVDNYNDAAALYWTFVGLWVVPGDELERAVVMQAILVDTRTGAILGTASGDCRRKRVVPMAYRDIARDKLSAEVPAKALADMQSGCADLFQDLSARAGQVPAAPAATAPVAADWAPVSPAQIPARGIPTSGAPIRKESQP